VGRCARKVDAQGHVQVDPGIDHKLYGYPVVVSSQTTAATASTTSGPLFGRLDLAMTLRVGGGVYAAS
jgi:hypothetical protein